MNHNDLLDILHNLEHLITSGSERDREMAKDEFTTTLISAENEGLLKIPPQQVEYMVRQFLFILGPEEVIDRIKFHSQDQGLIKWLSEYLNYAKLSDEEKKQIGQKIAREFDELSDEGKKQYLAKLQRMAEE